MFDIDEMVTTTLRLVDLGKNIPTGVKLHPDDFVALVKECTEPAKPSAFNLPVSVDPTIERGTYKLLYRDPTS